MLAIEFKCGQQIAFMDATSEPLDVGVGLFVWHGAQTHPHLSVMGEDQERDEIGIRLTIVLGQPAEHGCEFMAKKASFVTHRTGAIGFGQWPQRVYDRAAAVHRALKH